jgi:hypothetical protein
VQQLSLGAVGDTTLGHRDEAFDEGPQLLGPWHGGFDVFVSNERLGLIPEHGDPVIGDPAQFSMSDSVTHDC